MKRRHFLQLGLAGLATTTLSGCFGCWPNHCHHDYRTRYNHDKNTKVKLYYDKSTIIVLSPDFTLVKHYPYPDVFANLPNSLLQKAFLRFGMDKYQDFGFSASSTDTRTSWMVSLIWRYDQLTASEKRLLDKVIEETVAGNKYGNTLSFEIEHDRNAFRFDFTPESITGMGKAVSLNMDEKRIVPELFTNNGSVFVLEQLAGARAYLGYHEEYLAYLYAPTSYPSGFFDNAREAAFNPTEEAEYDKEPPSSYAWQKLPSPVKIDERGRVSLDGKALTHFKGRDTFLPMPKTTQSN